MNTFKSDYFTKIKRIILLCKKIQQKTLFKKKLIFSLFLYIPNMKTDLNKSETYQKTKAENERRKIEAYKLSKNDESLRKNRRLYFYEYIVKSQNLSWAEFSRLSGIGSQQSIHWKLVADDATMSFINKSIEFLNIKVQPSFKPKEMSTISNENFEITGINPIIRRNGTKEQKPCVTKRIEKGGVLKFLAEFIRDSNLAFCTFCRRAGLDVHAMQKWLEEDDIKISRLYQIAEVYDQKIIWEIVEIKKN